MEIANGRNIVSYGYCKLDTRMDKGILRVFNKLIEKMSYDFIPAEQQYHMYYLETWYVSIGM